MPNKACQNRVFGTELAIARLCLRCKGTNLFIKGKYLLLLIFLHCNFSVSEIYNDELERHTDVVFCYGEKPYQTGGIVYLDKDQFLKEFSIEELVRKLIKLDIEYRQAASEIEPTKDLHSSEGTRYNFLVSNYLDAYDFGEVVRCAAENYESGDSIFYYENTSIKPGYENGFVYMRNGTMVVRIVTEALYSD